MIFTGIKKALFVSAHPDDIEFACGGTLAKMIDNNIEIYLIVFSKCEKSTPKEYNIGIVEKELYKSCKFLGIKNIKLLNYEVRKLSYSRQEILEDLINYRKEINPDIIFIPDADDIHQDHNVIALEGLRAFKKDTTITYNFQWNNISFCPNLFIELEEKYIKKKIKAISYYKSQISRTYLDKNYLLSCLKSNGLFINKSFAETFKIIKWIE